MGCLVLLFLLLPAIAAANDPAPIETPLLTELSIPEPPVPSLRPAPVADGVTLAAQLGTSPLSLAVPGLEGPNQLRFAPGLGLAPERSGEFVVVHLLTLFTGDDEDGLRANVQPNCPDYKPLVHTEPSGAGARPGLPLTGIVIPL